MQIYTGRPRVAEKGKQACLCVYEICWFLLLSLQHRIGPLIDSQFSGKIISRISGFRAFVQQ